MPATLQDLAREALSWFTTTKRGEGEEAETIVVTRDGRPDWLETIIYDAHGDLFPDDWRYAAIMSAVEFISESDDDPDDGAGEWADGEVDIYTHSRLKWLGSNLSRPSYCDEARDEMGGEGLDIVELVGWGQYREASEVFGLVLQGLRDRLDEIDGDDDDDLQRRADEIAAADRAQDANEGRT